MTVRSTYDSHAFDFGRGTWHMVLARRMTRLASVIVASWLIALSSAAWAETWVLMGREGGCVSLADAAAQKPEFEGIAGPEDLAQKLRAQGHTVTLNEIGTAETRVVAVEAPDAGIAVVFVPERKCGD